MRQGVRHIVPSNFIDPEFDAKEGRLCPICGKPDWCLHGDGWALCQRVESANKWKDAGWFHRLNGGLSHRKRERTCETPETTQSTSKSTKYHWPSTDAAEKAFAALVPVRNDVAARAFLSEEYGIPQDAAPDAFRAFKHPHQGAGIVYCGADCNGGAAFKFRAFERRANGSRYCTFLAEQGGDPWILLEFAQDAPWAVTGGEEKGLAAWLAGYNTLVSLTGEHAPGEEWLDYLKGFDPARVVVANDCDEKGREANRTTARALELAGFDPGRVFCVAWPEATPDQFDLNDVLKAHGAAGVRNLLDSAMPHVSLLPRRFGIDDFFGRGSTGIGIPYRRLASAWGKTDL